MPLAFPSHQGLIAPLWRRWPQYFDVPAMIVGAAMPDVVDGCVGLVRGHLGQAYGHTILGLFLFCVPGGVLLWFLMHALMRQVPRLSGEGWWAATWNRGIQVFLDAPPAGVFRNHFGILIWSLTLGAFSHMFFDLISHGGFKWFYPWYVNTHPFPDWWYIRWAEIPLPGYKDPHPFGPHLLVWIFLSILGTVLLLRRPKGR